LKGKEIEKENKGRKNNVKGKEKNV